MPLYERMCVCMYTRICIVVQDDSGLDCSRRGGNSIADVLVGLRMVSWSSHELWALWTC